MDRRRFLLSTSLFSMAPVAVFADPTDKPREPGVMPYLSVGPFQEDAHKVYFFYLYTCPFCFEHSRAIQSWGATLPQSVRLVSMPVITDATSLSAAAAYYTVKSLDPTKLAQFHSAAYQRSRASFVTPDTYIQILRELGIPAQIDRNAIDAQLKRVVMLMARYRTAATPHFGVCGQFATNANFTNGDYRLLGQLLNALVSQNLGAQS